MNKLISLLLLALLLALPACGATDGTSEIVPVGPTPVALYFDMRDLVLTVDPADIGLSPVEGGPQVWGVLMEIGLSSGMATLVVVADGTTSLYFSNGGGILGAGETPAVAAAAVPFLVAAEEALPQMTASDTFALPEIGQVTFHVLTYDGGYTVDALEQEVQAEDHPLHTLYALGQDVITQIRLSEENE